jgi:hypothetical protein
MNTNLNADFSPSLNATLKTRFEMIVRVLTFSIALLMLLAGRTNAQKDPKEQRDPGENAPRPLEALGMNYAALSAHLGACKNECRQQEREAKLGHRATFEVPPYSYTVENGKVVEVMITATSFDDFLAEGRAKWGPPNSLKYQVMSNQDGTEARNGTARWDLPNGVVVDAKQTPVPGKVVGVTKLNLGGQPVLLTEKEPATQGALVVITNPPAPAAKPKPRPLL